MDYRADIRNSVQLLPLRDAFLLQPPVWWQTVGVDLHVDSATSVAGQLNRGRGEVQSYSEPKYQDTFITGATHPTGGSFTGTAFDSVLGTWRSDWLTKNGKYGLLLSDGSKDVQFAVKQTASDSDLTDRLILVHRGIAAHDASRLPADYNCYLELNYLSTHGSYRIAIESGRPLRLEYQKSILDPTGDGDTAWRSVCEADRHCNADFYLKHHGGNIPFHVSWDKDRGDVVVKVGDHDLLRHSPSWKVQSYIGSLETTPVLPNIGRVYFSGKNGWAALECHVLRHGAVTVQKGKKGERPLGNTAQAQFITNLLGPDQPTAAITGTAQQDADGKLSYTLNAALPDSGDGLGSDKPVRLSDVTVFFPAKWEYWRPLGVYVPGNLRSTHVVEEMTWDDQNRIGYTQGSLHFQNWDSRDSEASGNYALNLVLGNGRYAAQRLTGLCGQGPLGIAFDKTDVSHIGQVNFCDFMHKLRQDLGQEVILDGLAVNKAVRLLLEIGSVHPFYMADIFDPGFPPYPDNYFAPILPKGSGLNPKYRFGPDSSILSILLTILSDLGEVRPGWYPPYTTTVTPYYFWFDPYGQAHFRPWDPTRERPVKMFSTFLPESDIVSRMYRLRRSQSVENLRTEVVVQGQDAKTYELMQAHIPLSDRNKAKVGYRYPVLERNSRYVSEAAMYVAGRNLEKVCSVETDLIECTSAFDPRLFPGMVVRVMADGEVIQTTGDYIVLKMVSTLDSSSGVCETNWLLRNRAIDAVGF